MNLVHFEYEAEQDLMDIGLYVARNSPQAALRLVNSIEAQCHFLATSPFIGRSREELAPELRSFPVGNYIIFYRPVEDGMEIVRVVNAARDMESLF